MKNISPLTWLFLGLGLLIQIVTYTFMPNTPLSLVSGMLGICSVVLGAQGNILTFVFGFAQVGTYTYLCVAERFYGEIAMNIYYFITIKEQNKSETVKAEETKENKTEEE